MAILKEETMPLFPNFIPKDGSNIGPPKEASEPFLSGTIKPTLRRKKGVTLSFAKQVIQSRKIG